MGAGRSCNPVFLATAVRYVNVLDFVSQIDNVVLDAFRSFDLPLILLLLVVVRLLDDITCPAGYLMP